LGVGEGMNFEGLGENEKKVGKKGNFFNVLME
jgi:hypothetical protein